MIQKYYNALFLLFPPAMTCGTVSLINLNIQLLLVKLLACNPCIMNIGH